MKRYDIEPIESRVGGHRMVEREDGYWVKWEDYENDRKCTGTYIQDLEWQLGALREENAKLKEKAEWPERK